MPDRETLKFTKFPENFYDVTLLFGPMYHLFDENDKLKALNEAKRVTKKVVLFL